MQHIPEQCRGEGVLTSIPPLEMGLGLSRALPATQPILRLTRA